MKILLADAMPAEYVKKIEELGNEVHYNPDLGADDIPGNIKGVNVLVVRSTKVTAEAVNASDTLSLVIRAGSGFNTIDTEACADRGIFVANCPGLNSVAVAELAMAHILSLDRNIPDCVMDLRAGKWNKGKYAKSAGGLKGRSIGIIGFGNIGQEVGKRAKSFDIKVKVNDPVKGREFVERWGADYIESVEDLCAVSDFVSVHVPLNKHTENLIDAECFNRMKPGTFVINTSRGGVVNEEAFIKAAEEKNIRGGFDVFSDEPNAKSCDYVSKLAQHPNVYGTHHIGASTMQAQLAVAGEVLDLIKLYMEGGHVKNAVNLDTSSRARAVLSIRHFDRVGVLAEIFRILKDENINVEDMENIILVGEKTACARIRINKKLDDLSKIYEDEAIKDAMIHIEMFDL